MAHSSKRPRIFWAGLTSLWMLGLLLSPGFGARLQAQGDSEAEANSLQVYEGRAGLVLELVETMGESLSYALHFVGSILPLRGVASFAADLGVPGAASLMEMLTPRHRRTHRDGPEDIDRADEELFPPTTSYTLYKDEMSSLIGAVLGEDQCLLKLACLSGKHVNTLSGASTVTMLISAASGYLPHNFQTPYMALRESVMYTTNCQQYLCAAA